MGHNLIKNRNTLDYDVLLEVSSVTYDLKLPVLLPPEHVNQVRLRVLMNDHELMLLEVAHRTWPPFSVSARTASTIGAIFFQESTGSRKDPFDPMT